MATYQFPDRYGDVKFINPTISMHGQAGTVINRNVPEDTAFCDILIEVEGIEDCAYRLEGSPKPVDWTTEELQAWVANELEKYKIAE